MKHAHLVDLVQQAYPKLWIACHVAHRTRGRPHGSGLTDRESSLLSHIGVDGADPGPLAQHLGIARSTLSAHIARLEGLGLLSSAVDERDQRRRRLTLTAAGKRALRADSALDARRVSALLDALPAAERESAVRGLVTLAQAAAHVTTRHSEHSE